MEMGEKDTKSMSDDSMIKADPSGLGPPTRPPPPQEPVKPVEFTSPRFTLRGYRGYPFADFSPKAESYVPPASGAGHKEWRSKRKDKPEDVDEYVDAIYRGYAENYPLYKSNGYFCGIEIDKNKNDDGTFKFTFHVKWLDETTFESWLKDTDEIVHTKPQDPVKTPILRLLVGSVVQEDLPIAFPFPDDHLYEFAADCLNFPRAFKTHFFQGGGTFLSNPKDPKKPPTELIFTVPNILASRLQSSVSLAQSDVSGCISGMAVVSVKYYGSLFSSIEKLKNSAEDILLVPQIFLRDVAAEMVQFINWRRRVLHDVFNAMHIGRSTWKLPKDEQTPTRVHDDDSRDNILAALLELHDTSATLHLGTSFLEVNSAKLEAHMRNSPNATQWRLYELMCEEMGVVVSERRVQLNDIEIYLQVLYNQMQQESTAQARVEARLALRDSSQMKAIAILTMTFLPTTALATIFSMNPFFQDDQNGSLIVSHHFWIFWAIAIPVTLVVIIMYIGWIQRAEIQNKALAAGIDGKSGGNRNDGSNGGGSNNNNNDGMATALKPSTAESDSKNRSKLQDTVERMRLRRRQTQNSGYFDAPAGGIDRRITGLSLAEASQQPLPLDRVKKAAGGGGGGGGGANVYESAQYNTSEMDLGNVHPRGGYLQPRPGKKHNGGNGGNGNNNGSSYAYW